MLCCLACSCARRLPPPAQPLEVPATAIAAWARPGVRASGQAGHAATVVLGDAEGRLSVWDTVSGRCASLPTG
jgi:hypothetical protein